MVGAVGCAGLLGCVTHCLCWLMAVYYCGCFVCMPCVVLLLYAEVELLCCMGTASHGPSEGWCVFCAWRKWCSNITQCCRGFWGKRVGRAGFVSACTSGTVWGSWCTSYTCVCGSCMFLGTCRLHTGQQAAHPCVCAGLLRLEGRFNSALLCGFCRLFVGLWLASSTHGATKPRDPGCPCTLITRHFRPESFSALHSALLVRV